MTIVDSLSFGTVSPDLLRARAVARGFDLHFHDAVSVVVLRRGVARLWSKRWSRSAGAGDVFFFNPFEAHSGEIAENEVEYDVLYLSQRLLRDCLPAADAGARLKIATDVRPASPETVALVAALSAARPDTASIETALAGVLAGCTVIAEAAADTARVGAALAAIDEGYASGLSTRELARRAGLNQSHFVRSFHKVTGIAPQAYLRQVRIARAKALVCAGASLSEAALSAGFCDQAHFTRAFKQVYGVPPGRLSRDIRRARAA